VKLQIRQRDRRALLMLSLALLVYGLANWVVIPAYDRLSAAGDVAAEKQNQLRRYRRAELRKGQYANLLKVANDRLTKSESVVIAAANASLASAELQSLIEGAGSKVGLTVIQRTLGNPRRLNDFYAELPMTISFDSTPGQLVSFLSELRSIPRLITVRNLQVSPTSPVSEAPKGVDLLKNIRVNMTLGAVSPIDIVRREAVAK
jgi:Tfp pilus assembly protein PilO